MPTALDAVFFDWGDTLFHFAYDDALLEAGWEAGLAAIGRSGLPAHHAAAARFRERYLPLLGAREDHESLEEVEYPAMIRELLSGFGVELSDEELARFLAAEHEVWEPALESGTVGHALLDSLRDRGLKLALVSNAKDPTWLLEEDLRSMGLAERLDAAVFSSEVGVRKPHPAMFERALAALGVEPARTLFVGDSLYADVWGAKKLGMTTVQALWFRADDDERGVEPDYRAFTPIDVLNVVRRLVGET
ncbi:MAG: HAD family hydrolase [Thermoleophilia bacterium]|nr:HAD family hydrolase [Thermoleophilia bacterium]